MADDGHLLAMKARHAAHQRGVIGEAAIAMNLAPIGEDSLDVFERKRPLRVARQFRLFPGPGMDRDLVAQGIDALVKLLDLVARAVVLRRRLQLGDLLFNLFEFLLPAGIHVPAVAVRGGASLLHHGQKELRARDRWVGIGRQRPRFWLRTPGCGRLHPPPISVNHPHCAWAAQLFDARHKIAVRLHIIAFRLHHHHEISRTFHVKQHFRLAPFLEAERL